MKDLRQVLRVVAFGVPESFDLSRRLRLRAELCSPSNLGEAAKYCHVCYLADRKDAEPDQGICVEIVGTFYIEHGQTLAEMVGEIFKKHFPSTRIDCEVRERLPSTIGYWTTYIRTRA
jgi:hypothetical protein